MADNIKAKKPYPAPTNVTSFETMKVESADKDGYTIINKHDFDEDKHVPFDEDDDDNADEADGNAPVASNASGTFDEPTPSDIRYPNKDNTEFENNHGAYVGQSAAELRDGAGMEQKPGGLDPSVHEEVQGAAEDTRRAQERAAAPSRGKIQRKAFVDQVSPPKKVKPSVKDDGDVAKKNGKPDGDKKSGSTTDTADQTAKQ